MKLYGLLVVQNESDVIEDLLQFLQKLGIYETIFFYDLGSTDDTFAKAQKYKEILHNPQVLACPYTEKLRYDLLAEHSSMFHEGDWMSIIDADEFYVDDPIAAIRNAEAESATCIRTYQIQFMFTDADLMDLGKEDFSLPVYERRKFYLINWSEARFFKFFQDGFINSSRPAARRFLNRHYQYRTPQQMQSRIATRLENRKKTRGIRGRQDWPQIFSTNWKDYVVPFHIHHRYDGADYRFGLPPGVNWKDYFGKDPFSPILPQIAFLFQQERNCFDSDGGSSNAEMCPGNVLFQPGRVTFVENFGSHVAGELREHFLNRGWKLVLEGASVYLHYWIRTFIKFMPGRWEVATFKARGYLRSVLNNLKRIARGKSVGVITAHPNPVEVSDISGSGIVSLQWKSRGAEKVEIHIDAPDGQIIHSGNASGTVTTGRWISNDMIFYLQDVSSGLPLRAENTLSTVQVKVGMGNKITI